MPAAILADLLPPSDEQPVQVLVPVPGEVIFVYRYSILWTQGGMPLKKLTYDGQRIDAAVVTRFQDGAEEGAASRELSSSQALAVFIEEFCYIYYTDGRTHVVHLPFVPVRVLGYERGLILQHKPAPSSETAPYTATPVFFSMVDPILDLGVVVSSSTSAISASEDIVYVSPDSRSSLFVTVTQNVVSVYHLRPLAKRQNGFAAAQSSAAKRRSSSRRVSSASARLPGGAGEETAPLEPIGKESRIASLDPALEPGKNAPASLLEVSMLRRDAVVTKVNQFHLPEGESVAKAELVLSEGQEALILLPGSTNGDPIQPLECHIFLFHSAHGPVSVPRFQFRNTFVARDFCVADSSAGLLLVSETPRTFKLLDPFRLVVSAPFRLSRSADRFLCASECVVTAQSGSEVVTFALHLKPQNTLVARGLEIFRCLMGERTYTVVRVFWFTAVGCSENSSEWDAFVAVVFAFFFQCFHDTPAEPVPGFEQLGPLLAVVSAEMAHSASDPALPEMPDVLPSVVLGLHLLREDCKLDVTATSAVAQLGLLLRQLCSWLGWSDRWLLFYDLGVAPFDRTSRCLLPEPVPRPPNITESLVSLFGGPIVPLVTLSELAEGSEQLDELLTPRMYAVLKLYEGIVSSAFSDRDVVEMMAELGISAPMLETFPTAVAVPLKTAIAACRTRLALSGSPEAGENAEKLFGLTGRHDLSALEHADPFRSLPQMVSGVDRPQDVHSLLATLREPETVSPWDSRYEADRIAVTRLIFHRDRRFAEALRLLQNTKPQILPAPPGFAELSESAALAARAALAHSGATRTLTAAFGKAALVFSSRVPLMTEKCPLPKLHLGVQLRPFPGTVYPDKTAFSEAELGWANFHAGVLAGLSVSRDFPSISGSWVVFNKPLEGLTAGHAGFLLGLGLNGHLKRLEEWHVYNYLGPKHIYTSVGLLLGMSASARGTLDGMLTKILSVHVIAMLPPGSSSLNVHPQVQTAGLVGLGLVYLGSQHRRMCEVHLAELVGHPAGYPDAAPSTLGTEAYRLAAGVGLGLINLARGRPPAGLGDLRLEERLLALAVGKRDFQTVLELDQSAAGALLALGFMFLQTEDRDMATRLAVPDTMQMLEYVRPDLLLLLTLVRNLICWKSICGNREWIEAQVPPGIWAGAGRGPLDSSLLPRYHIIVGAAFAVALRYASSGDASVCASLEELFDEFRGLVEIPARTFDEKLTQKTLKELIALLGLLLAVVMAGTGDLGVLRRLRVLHNSLEAKPQFGCNVASSMALGVLFLGGGQYGFRRDPFSVACMVLAMYPLLPRDCGDQDVCLQALRHFWAMAVERRCLVVRDAETKQPIRADVTLELRDGTERKVATPALLPDPTGIAVIRARPANCFPVEIDCRVSTGLSKPFLSGNYTVYVTRMPDGHAGSRFQAGILRTEEEKEKESDGGDVLKAVADLRLFRRFEKSEVAAFIESATIEPSQSVDLSAASLDTKLSLTCMLENVQALDDLWTLRLLFAFCDARGGEEVDERFVEGLKQDVWQLKKKFLA